MGEKTRINRRFPLPPPTSFDPRRPPRRDRRAAVAVAVSEDINPAPFQGGMGVFVVTRTDRRTDALFPDIPSGWVALISAGQKFTCPTTTPYETFWESLAGETREGELSCHEEGEMSSLF